MVAVCAAVAGASIYSLYRVAHAVRLDELRGAAETLAALMESVAQFDLEYSAGDHPQGSRGATLSQIERGLVRRNALLPSEELVIGERDGAALRVMRRAAEGGIEYVTTVAQAGEVAEPLVRALRGERGSGDFLDYRGVQVLAGYAFVPSLNIGIVYKIDLDDMRAPFLRAAAWVALGALLLSALAAWSLIAMVRPLQTRAREERAFSDAVMESAGALVVVLDREGRIRRFNRACEELSGYRFAEVEGRFPWDTFLPPEDAAGIRDNAFEALARNPAALKGRYINYWLTRAGERRLTEWSNTLLLDTRGEMQYMVSIGVDITESRQARDELEQSRARLRNVLDSLYGFVGVYSLDGRLLEANDAPLRAAGGRREDVIGKPFWDTYWWNYSAEVQAQLRDALRRAALGEVVRYDVPVRIRDGGFITIDVQFGPLREANGEIVQVIGFAVDVTQRKRAEDATRVSEARLVAAQRIAHVGSWELDLVANRLAWSEEIFRIFEVDPEKSGASYEAFLNAIHPDDREAVNRAYTESVANRTPYEITHRLRMADGRVKWVRERCETICDAADRPLRSAGTVQDITKERMAEQHLREERAFSAAIYDSTPALVIVHDRQGRIVRFNDAAAQAAGYRKEELVGRYTWEFLMGTPEDRRDTQARYAVLASMTCAQALERFGSQVTRTWRTRDGRLRLIAWNLAYLPDENGMVAYQVACGADITDRKTSEDRLRAALAEKDVLLQEIYHRVKNNLQVVASLLNMQGRQVADAGMKELLAESANRVKSMALVHEQLYRSGDLSNISLAEYLKQLIEYIAHAHQPLSARVPVRLEAAGLKLGIETAVPLGLMVNELVSNAYKHGYGPQAARGEIVLRMEALEDGRVRLEVMDDGRGLPEGFDPKAASSLGLQLVLTLAQQLGGELRHASSAGRTSFEVLFRPEAREVEQLVA